ncbi:hypothetical protein BH20ACT23_BH20ACT23_12700 [soil metagenome]
MSAYLGLRWEEVSALKPRDLELNGPIGIVHVRGTLPRSDGRIVYRTYGKTASARRSLKVPEFLRQALKLHLASYSNANWIFPAPNGGFLRGDNFRTRSWIPATEAGGLAGSDSFTFHELRHTAAAFMIDEGADPLQVMRRMGHSDIRTTYNLYGHLFPDREDDLVAKLDGRYFRALRANGREETPALEENGFDSALTQRPLTLRL